MHQLCRRDLDHGLDHRHLDVVDHLWRYLLEHLLMNLVNDKD